MSRSEWLTIVVLLSAILAVLLINLVYQHFIWKDVCAMWQILWKEAFREDIQKLHMGDLEIREYGKGHGGGVGGSGPPISKSLRDASSRSPFIY